MEAETVVKIESRVHLLSALAEAAELEHNLLCMYLYSAFSLKTSSAEGLSIDELEAVTSWRKIILKIAFEEMTHMALVANLTTAVGGGAHFYRLDFPVRPGYFPAEFVLELARFDFESLQHFIFLERPETEPIADANDFVASKTYTRGSPGGRLMAHGGDYSTVGQLYDAIERGIVSLSAAFGEKNLFCGSSSLQICSKDVQIDGLNAINDRESALASLRLIVTQGEGARSKDGSHFEKFSRIADEFDALRAQNEGFEPSRPAARNPLMRKPTDSEGRVWVNEPSAVPYLDLANALYGLMLRFLVQVYSMEDRNAAARKTLLESAFSIMHALSTVATMLTKLRANSKCPGVTAGVSFALDRYFTAFEVTSEKLLILERVEEIKEQIRIISTTSGDKPNEELINERSQCLVSVQKVLDKIEGALRPLPLEADDA